VLLSYENDPCDVVFVAIATGDVPIICVSFAIVAGCVTLDGVLYDIPPCVFVAVVAEIGVPVDWLAFIVVVAGCGIATCALVILVVEGIAVDGLVPIAIVVGGGIIGCALIVVADGVAIDGVVLIAVVVGCDIVDCALIVVGVDCVVTLAGASIALSALGVNCSTNVFLSCRISSSNLSSRSVLPVVMACCARRVCCSMLWR
jgi:hypothetical protein